MVEEEVVEVEVVEVVVVVVRKVGLVSGLAGVVGLVGWVSFLFAWHCGRSRRGAVVRPCALWIAWDGRREGRERGWVQGERWVGGW